jgi:hypothetical protein
MNFPTWDTYANFLSTWMHFEKLIIEVNIETKHYCLMPSLTPLLIGGKPIVA